MCGQECDEERGCFIAKAEQGRFMRIKEAKALCAVCPDKDPCLKWALATKQPFGIWGGKTERDRRVILKQAKDNEESNGDQG